MPSIPIPMLRRTIYGSTQFLHQFDGTSGNSIDNEDATGLNFLNMSIFAVNSNVDPKFGTTCFRATTGSSQGFETATRTAMSPGDGDFCIEGWFKFEALPSAFAVPNMGLTNTVGQGISINLQDVSGSPYDMVANLVSVEGSQDLSITGFATVNTWHHIAISRDGSNIRIFRDGSLIETFAVTAVTFSNQNFQFELHVHGGNTASMDSVRAVIGGPVYTSAFTPAGPLALYP